jgi:hypothetical protein
MPTEAAVEAVLLPWGIRLVHYHDKVMAYPLVRTWKDVLVFLISISGAFWLISKAVSAVALLTHSMLDRALAELFAVSYNVVLAVLFSSVLVHGIIVERGGKDDFFYCQAAGFVLVYLVLGAAYTERSGHITEYAIPGFIAGLGSYLFFCLRTQYLVNSATSIAYQGIVWMMSGWPRRLIIAYAVAQALFYLARPVRSLFLRRRIA